MSEANVNLLVRSGEPVSPTGPAGPKGRAGTEVMTR